MEPTTVPSPGHPLTQDQIRELVQGPGEEWTYEMRRKCQEILPGLLLGPVQVAKSEETLRSLGVTHILCIRGVQEAFSIRPRFEGMFQYLVLDVEDNEEQNLIRLFPQAQAFIDNALNMGGRVLVHCNVGISLSPAFVVMYVMQRLQITWEDALHMVQNRRYCISPNGGFLTQIKEYESIYKANVAIQQHPGHSGSTTRRKREEGSDDEDAARTEDRKRPLVEDEDVAMQM